MRHFFLLLLCMALAIPAQAGSFPVFDGQFYNGLYYPMVDAIEWGEQYGDLPHMEFHLHSKDKPIELTVVPGDKGGKPVLWLMYDLKFRGERVCRHIIAPSHFKEGMKLFTYRDNTDVDYDNIYVSSKPMAGKNLVPYEMQPYEPCTDEHASNKPDSLPRLPASVPAERAAPVEEKKEGKNIGVDYDNHAVPFSF